MIEKMDSLRKITEVGVGGKLTAGAKTGNYDFEKGNSVRPSKGVLKHTIDGDTNVVTESEVLELLNGNGSGSV